MRWQAGTKTGEMKAERVKILAEAQKARKVR